MSRSKRSLGAIILCILFVGPFLIGASSCSQKFVSAEDEAIELCRRNFSSGMADSSNFSECISGVAAAIEAIFLSRLSVINSESDLTDDNLRAAVPSLKEFRNDYMNAKKTCVQAESPQLQMACMDGVDYAAAVLARRGDFPISARAEKVVLPRSYFARHQFMTVFDDLPDDVWVYVLRQRVYFPEHYPAYRRDEMYAITDPESEILPVSDQDGSTWASTQMIPSTQQDALQSLDDEAEQDANRFGMTDVKNTNVLTHSSSGGYYLNAYHPSPSNNSFFWWWYWNSINTHRYAYNSIPTSTYVERPTARTTTSSGMGPRGWGPMAAPRPYPVGSPWSGSGRPGMPGARLSGDVMRSMDFRPSSATTAWRTGSGSMAQSSVSRSGLGSSPSSGAYGGRVGGTFGGRFAGSVGGS